MATHPRRSLLSTQDQQDDLAAKIDGRYLTDILVELAHIPTEVPLGSQVFMEPDDPKLVHYVQNKLRPKLDALGVQHITDVPDNQLLIRYGDRTSKISCLFLRVI